MRFRDRRPRGNLQVVRDVVVVAEGKDDADLVQWLLSHPLEGRPNLDDAVQVIDAQSVDKVAAMVDKVIKSDLFQARGRGLGVVRDSDGDPAAALALVNRAFAASGVVDVPAAGRVVVDGPRCVGVFLSPDGTTSGTVDHLYLAAADTDRRSLASSQVDEIERRWGPVRYRPKTTLQLLLGGMDRSPRQPGDGLQQGLVSSSVGLEPLADFLVALARA